MCWPVKNLCWYWYIQLYDRIRILELNESAHRQKKPIKVGYRYCI
jgi:hypothetical protein